MANLKEPTNDAKGKIYSEPRRTQRVQIAMSVAVSGIADQKPFQENTKTVTVNANGCLVLLATKVTRGQKLTIINPQTQEELPCTASFLGDIKGNKSEVGLEFSEPSPKFWRIAFPPLDWDPSERKRADAPRPPSSPPTAPRK
jgi:hypothetical protein